MNSSLKMLAAVAGAVLALAMGYWLGARQTSHSALHSDLAMGSPGVQPSVTRTGEDPYLAGPVRNTLRKQAPAMQQLWLTHLAQPQAKQSGVVEIDWRVNRNGQPQQVSIVSSTLGDKQLEDGLVRIIANLNFPAPDVSEKYVAHTFRFKKDDGAQ